MTLGIVLFLLLGGMVLAEGRLPKQLQNQNEVLHHGNTFWGFGSQVIKSSVGGSSVKRVWDKRKGENKEEVQAKAVAVNVKETPQKYVSYGIQSNYGSSPYAQGGFGAETRSYGLSKQKLKHFVKKQAEEAPTPASQAKVAVGSTASEPPIPEPEVPTAS